MVFIFLDTPLDSFESDMWGNIYEQKDFLVQRLPSKEKSYRVARRTGGGEGFWFARKGHWKSTMIEVSNDLVKQIQSTEW